MVYRSYQHVERLENSEVDGILRGTCSIQPKIDGTNGVVWLNADGVICAGSRKRELTLENDNAAFYANVLKDKSIKKYLDDHPNRYLYGEWLVPHTIRYYNCDAWNKFYVFDVYADDRGYIPFKEYSKELEEYGILYIPEVEEIENPSLDDLGSILKSSKFIIPEDKIAEGIVIKKYEFKNQYGRTTWAKIIAEEFFQTKQSLREKRHKVKKQKPSEEEIVALLLSEPLIRKEFSKLKLEFPDIGKQEMIGRILNNIWHVFLNEEFMNYAEKKRPKVEFNILKKSCDSMVKDVLCDELFKKEYL